MKRTILAIVLAIFCGSSMFAQDQQRQEFLDKLMASVNHCRELLYAGQHKEAIAPITDLIAFLDTTTIYKVEGIGINQDMLNEEKSMHQYDLACCYALLGQKKPALEALEQSVANGYNNYHNIINDKDLQSLHKDKRFQKLLQTIKENTKIEVLRKSNAYDFADMSEIPQFQYQTMDEKNLQRVREYFKLDTIPGKDDELTHIKNLLHFAHDNIRHNGSNMAICEFDAIDIYNYNRSTGNGVNCRQLALSLCDMYLSMGYKARVVTCLPADPNDYECHVINAVYSETLNKWLYIDPTMDAWVMDDNGTMLSIAEVRERLINDQPLVLCETANWNHENPQSKEYYLETYMAKNLYYFVCKNRSCFNQESIYYDTQNEDVRLIPAGFVNDNFGKAATTTNPDIFWAKPQSDAKHAEVKAVYLEETELLSIVSHLAQINGYDWDAEDVGVDDYLADVDSTFAAYSNHPIIPFVKEELAKRGFAWHFPMHVALRLHIADGKILYNNSLQQDFDDYYDYISKENENKFLELLEDFYNVSDFHNFFMAHKPVYTECENAMQHVIDQIDFKWYDTFFGSRNGSTFHIYPNILIGPANYAVHQKIDGGAEIINAVMGCCLQDSNGKISYDTYSTLPIIIHECNHSYCNPLNEEFWPQLQKAMDAFFEANAQFYTDEAYGGAQYVLNETFVEACVMHYLKSHPLDFSENIDRWQKVLKITDEQMSEATDRISLLNDKYIELLTKIDDENKRFYMIRDVIKVLEEREQHPEAFPTMHDFMPRYIETINAYGTVVSKNSGNTL